MARPSLQHQKGGGFQARKWQHRQRHPLRRNGTPPHNMVAGAPPYSKVPGAPPHSMVRVEYQPMQWERHSFRKGRSTQKGAPKVSWYTGQFIIEKKEGAGAQGREVCNTCGYPTWVKESP